MAWPCEWPCSTSLPAAARQDSPGDGAIMRILIKGGRVIDPANAVDDVLDVFVEDGKLLRVEKHTGGRRLEAGGAEPTEAGRGKGSKTAKQAESALNVDRILDATGLVVCPGLIDMHVHLRQQIGR